MSNALIILDNLWMRLLKEITKRYKDVVQKLKLNNFVVYWRHKLSMPLCSSRDHICPEYEGQKIKSAI